MRREFHVRFCESPRVQFPRATRLVVLFQRKEDAVRFLDVLPKRLGKYGLNLHPDKTQLVPFQRPDRVDENDDGAGTFNLLGFTHYWALSRKGHWVVKQKTAKDRFRRALRRLGEWCRWHRHDPLKTQYLTLDKKLKGHYAYYGITGNFHAIAKLFHEVVFLWQSALARRSQKRLPWRTMRKLLERFPLSAPRIVHRYGT